MRKLFSTLTIILAGLCIANAQVSEGKMNDILKINKNYYMIVFPFENHRQYAEFEHNKSLMSKAVENINEAKRKAELEKNPETAKLFEDNVKRLQDEFNTNNQTMVKGYNFSADRKYLVLFLKTYICTPITAEEFSVLTFKDGKKIDPLKIVDTNSGKFYRSAEISGFQENQNLQSLLTLTMKNRYELSKLRDSLSDLVDVQKISDVSKRIVDLEKDIAETQKILSSKYNLDANSRYMLEIDKARLLLELSPEELKQVQQEQQMQKN